MKALTKKFWVSESGATAIEYALIAALVVSGLIALFVVLGGEVEGLFEYTEGEVTKALSPGAQ